MINDDRSENVCIAYSEKVKSLAEPAEFDKILNSLKYEISNDLDSIINNRREKKIIISMDFLNVLR